MNSDRHDELLDRLLCEAKLEPSVIGVMLQGSVARGDHNPGSDLDLLVLVEEGRARDLVPERIGSVWVERHFQDAANLRLKLARRPMLAYGIVDGRILFDPQRELVSLVGYATALLTDYVTPRQTLEDLRYWLHSTRIKLEAATAAGDELKASYLAATNAWKVLEGVWAVNGLPMPPSGAVLSRIRDLAEQPNEFASRLDILFLGTTEQRIASSLKLIDWVMAKLPPERQRPE